MCRLLSTSLALSLFAGCAPKPIPGVIEAAGHLEHIPGPMPGFGPYETYSDALIAACPLVMAMPHAIAGHPSDPNFRLFWGLSREYCAWIYRTPTGKYEMSMLAAGATQENPRLRRCNLPSFVADSRYSAGDLGYLFAIHNHPYPSEPSTYDVRFIIDEGRIHGFFVNINGQDTPISIVAFYSESGFGSRPTCDGFFQYTPPSNDVLRWTTNGQGTWHKTIYARVKWNNSGDFDIEKIR